MPTLNYTIQYKLPPGSYGVLLEYKQAGAISWIKPTSPDNPTMADSYPLTLATGTTYYVRLTSQGPNCSPQIKLLTVIVPENSLCCPEGYTLSPDSTYCYKEETVAPTIQQSNVCVALSQLETVYSRDGTKLYSPGYPTNLNSSATHTLLTSAYWIEASNQVIGPMNRDGVWIDSDCDGVKDALTPGATLQFSFALGVSAPKTVYIGISGDNTFRFDHNGVTVVNADGINDGAAGSFLHWHLVPVELVSGTNNFTFMATGDGSVNDAFAAVIYDNTSAELQAATQDTDLTILFRTSTYRGSTIDLATCPAGYQLDTSGGAGSYTCRRTLTSSPTSC